jgi:DNA-binding beta-propeller fold protein YncE
LTYGLLPGNWFTVGLSYTPGGVAVDVARNRVYVADPSHNAIQIYNATTLAYEKTLT